MTARPDVEHLFHTPNDSGPDWLWIVAVTCIAILAAIQIYAGANL